ncbi:MAG: biotin--[acetyl-CoA-carboxylase] ligase [Puniceicoccales bacterium]|jgi:BirA family biotin operon repressor/biotin-[acetyl-CoA-carboxylase] ligase|nr:biotin--[acetyl-CoA-carboxylase] ligase [Puniceicoccales bacterium]
MKWHGFCEPMEIFRYDTIDSSNDECFRHFDRRQMLPFAIVATTQTKGKGQFDRTWYSADAGNLYVSFAFKPQQSPEKFQNFSIAVAEKIAERLQRTFGVPLTVKYPNDIYCDGKKMCGILTETRVVGHEIILAVTGIGLNVAGDISRFPGELQATATTLSACCKRKIPPGEVEAILFEIIEKLLPQHASQ